MRSHTLGFEDDKEITKIELGTVQLVEAINLFLAGNYICAITLAGASEDLFSGVLANLEKPSTTEKAIEQIENIRITTKTPIANNLPKNKIFSAWNSARNNLKHHSKGEDEKIRINLFDEAYWLIRRSLENAKMANIEIKNCQEFENWVIQNICM